jgi:hypothetical protein
VYHFTSTLANSFMLFQIYLPQFDKREVWENDLPSLSTEGQNKTKALFQYVHNSEFTRYQWIPNRIYC